MSLWTGVLHSMNCTLGETATAEFTSLEHWMLLWLQVQEFCRCWCSAKGLVWIGCCLGPGLHPSRSNTQVPGLERHRDSGTYSLAQWSYPRARFFAATSLHRAWSFPSGCTYFVLCTLIPASAGSVDASVGSHRAGLGTQEQAGGHDPTLCRALPQDPKVWFRVTKWTGFESFRK